MSEPIKETIEKNVVDLQAARDALLGQQELSAEPTVEKVPGAALPSRRPRSPEPLKLVIDEVPGVSGATEQADTSGQDRHPSNADAAAKIGQVPMGAMVQPPSEQQ